MRYTKTVLCNLQKRTDVFSESEVWVGTEKLTGERPFEIKRENDRFMNYDSMSRDCEAIITRVGGMWLMNVSQSAAINHRVALNGQMLFRADEKLVLHHNDVIEIGDSGERIALVFRHSGDPWSKVPATHEEHAIKKLKAASWLGEKARWKNNQAEAPEGRACIEWANANRNKLGGKALKHLAKAMMSEPGNEGMFKAQSNGKDAHLDKDFLKLCAWALRNSMSHLKYGIATRGLNWMAVGALVVALPTYKEFKTL
jgi:hypothetical protein